jgi:AraC-like DNA-binding protein
MTAIHQYISAVGSFQGVLMFLLLVCDRNTTAASKVLGLCCLSMGLAFFLPFITFGVASEVFYPFTGWLFFLPIMYGAFLHLYVSKVVFNEQFKVKDFYYIGPLLACYIFNVDVLFVDHDKFRLWIVGASAPTVRLWLSEYMMFGVVIAYLISTIFLIKRYHQQAVNNLSNFNPLIFRWLSILVLSFIVIFLAKGVMAFTHFATIFMLILSDAFILLIILFIALTQWKNPRFFVIGSDCFEWTLADHPVTTAQKSISALDDSTRASIFEELTKYVEREHSYRDSELSLAKLADSVGLSMHHLSEVLNQHAGQNFNHFINAYRVKEVCDNLHTSDTKKVLDIAMQAGFSSKSAFNSTFKKFMGVTPTQYRQMQKH